MIRVLITDDQHLFRVGLKALLERHEEIEVIGEASDGAQAVEQVLSLQPDVVLMDIRMPHVNGVEATRRIKEREPSPAVLILTTFDDDEEVLSAISAGAAGYLLKDSSGPQLRQAVHSAAAGEATLSPQIARKLMDRAAAGYTNAPQETFTELTEQEFEVFKAVVGKGHSNGDIAAELYLSPATVRTYVSRILTKLNARDRTELAVMAHRAGLV